MATSNKNLKLMSAIDDNNLQVVKLCLEKGADPNFRGKNNYSPLSKSIDLCLLEVFQLLLSRLKKQDNVRKVDIELAIIRVGGKIRNGSELNKKHTYTIMCRSLLKFFSNRSFEVSLSEQKRMKILANNNLNAIVKRAQENIFVTYGYCRGIEKQRNISLESTITPIIFMFQYEGAASDFGTVKALCSGTATKDELGKVLKKKLKLTLKEEKEDSQGFFRSYHSYHSYHPYNPPHRFYFHPAISGESFTL